MAKSTRKKSGAGPKRAAAAPAKRRKPTEADRARLARMRDALDALNLRIREDFDARARAVAAILAWKAERGFPARDVAREREMIARVAKGAGRNGGLSAPRVAALFRALIAATFEDVSRRGRSGARSSKVRA